MDLPEFLLARIAEDEDDARGARYVTLDHWWLPEFADPARVRADCEAKRRLVAEYVAARDARNNATTDPQIFMAFQTAITAMHPALAAFTLPHANHPDYDEAWRP